MEENCGLILSDEDFMMLLPAVLSSLNSILDQHHSLFGITPPLNSRILLNGFLHWGSFVSKDILEEESAIIYQEPFCLVDGCLLGKSIHMLQYHFSFSGVPMKLKKQLKPFDKYSHNLLHTMIC